MAPSVHCSDEPVPDWERVASSAAAGPSRPSTGNSAGIGDLEDDMSIDLPGPKTVRRSTSVMGKIMIEYTLFSNLALQ